MTLHLSFFFTSRRRHTISKRDWSSDVCSSDLLAMIIGVPLMQRLRIEVDGKAKQSELHQGHADDHGQGQPVPAQRSEERRGGKEGSERGELARLDARRACADVCR